MKRLLFFLSYTIVLCSCTTTKAPVVTNPRVPARFDFSPPSRKEAGATKLTIALLNPVYIGKEPEYFVAPFAEMASSMNNDFEELLTAKGFTIRGPFRSRDEMVYSDKTGSDFAFTVEIDLHPTYNRKTEEVISFAVLAPGGYSTSYKMKGEITLGGTLVITASSPQYGEKLWKKNIALDKTSFTYTGTIKWTRPPSVSEELRQDNLFYNVLARELEKFYTQALGLAWQQIDAEEMKAVAEQAKKADKKQ